MEQANERKKYLPEKRAEIMKQHLLEKKALSEVCDANGIHPTISIAKQVRFSMCNPVNTGDSLCIFRKTEAFGYTIVG